MDDALSDSDFLPIGELHFGCYDACGYGRWNTQLFLDAFVPNGWLDEILQPGKFFLVGDRGSGKTAHALYIKETSYGGACASIMNVEETGYHRIGRLAENGDLIASSYLDFWRSALLRAAARHIVDNEAPNTIRQKRALRRLQAVAEHFDQSAFVPEAKDSAEIVDASGVHAELGFPPVAAVGSRIAGETRFHEVRYQESLRSLEQELMEALAQTTVTRQHILFVDGVMARGQRAHSDCVDALAQAVWVINDALSQIWMPDAGTANVKIMLLGRPEYFQRSNLENAAARLADHGVLLHWYAPPAYRDSSLLFAVAARLLWHQQPGRTRQLCSEEDCWKHYFPDEGSQTSFFSGLLEFTAYCPRDVVACLSLLFDNAKWRAERGSSLRIGDLRQMIHAGKLLKYLEGEISSQLASYGEGVQFWHMQWLFGHMGGAIRYQGNGFTYDEFVEALHECLRQRRMPEILEDPQSALQVLYELNLVRYEAWNQEDRVDTQSWCAMERSSRTLFPKLIVSSARKYFVHPGLVPSLFGHVT